MKDFDKHFSKKITTHKFEFKPSAWDKMEQMLDDEDPRKTIGWRYPYMMILLGVFFIGFSLFSPTGNIENAVVEKAQATVPFTTNNTQSTMESATTLPAATSQVTVENDIISASATPISKVSIADNNRAIVKEISKTLNKQVQEQQQITTTFNKTNTTTTPATDIKRFIQQLPETPQKQENIQAFIELENNEIKPLEYEPLKDTSLPITMSPLLVNEKKVKVGVQAGASVVLAKRSTADQGKLATAIGGFVNFELNSKSTIAIEANYKNGYNEGIVNRSLSNRNGQTDPTAGNNISEIYAESYVREHGYAEVNQVNRVHAVEIPVLYKHKISTRNSVIAGVKPSLMKFSSTDKNEDTAASSFADLHQSVKATNLDVGLVAGIEHKLTKNLSVDLRYNQGLVDISDSDSVSNYNSDLALTVKYTF